MIQRWAVCRDGPLTSTAENVHVGKYEPCRLTLGGADALSAPITLTLAITGMVERNDEIRPHQFC